MHYVVKRSLGQTIIKYTTWCFLHFILNNNVLYAVGDKALSCFLLKCRFLEKKCITEFILYYVLLLFILIGFCETNDICINSP